MSGTQQLARIRDEVCLIRRNRSDNKQSKQDQLLSAAHYSLFKNKMLQKKYYVTGLHLQV